MAKLKSRTAPNVPFPWYVQVWWFGSAHYRDGVQAAEVGYGSECSNGRQCGLADSSLDWDSADLGSVLDPVTDFCVLLDKSPCLFPCV